MYLLNNGILKAVCWTLVHSLWQGLALAVVAGVVISLTKKSPALVRYRLLTLFSVIFVAGVFLTLASQWPSVESQQADFSSAQLQFQEGGTQTASSGFAPVKETSLLHIVTNFLNEYAAFVVVFWFIVFSIKFFRLLTGLQKIFRLRNYQTLVPDEFWIERFSELTLLMKIKGKVQLLESRLAIVPAVTGFIKPIILVPVGMLNNLPQDQVEAILLHELAHIRRSDYVYNLLQSMVDMLFFFNPGILWVSSLIRDERENCCDDMAISVTQDKTQFVNALVSFQQYHQNQYMPAMQFGASKNHLLNRAKRILMNDNKSLNVIEKSMLSFCMIAVVSMAFLTSWDTVRKEKRQSDQTVLSGQVSNLSNHILYADRTYNPDEFPEGTCVRFNDVIDGFNQPTYLFKIKDTLYQISGDIRIFKVNGRVIPQEQMKPYLPKIRSLLKQHQKQEEDLTEYITAAAPAQQTARPVQPSQPEFCSPAPTEKPQPAIGAAAFRPVGLVNRTTTTTSQERYELTTDNPDEVTDPLIINIMNDLKGLKINLGKESIIVSFKLEDGGLFVNGLKQTKEVHEKLNKKYIVPGRSIYYKYEVTSNLEMGPLPALGGVIEGLCSL